jgi:hypothetical protein
MYSNKDLLTFGLVSGVYIIMGFSTGYYVRSCIYKKNIIIAPLNIPECKYSEDIKITSP